jgi:hypothetical protein
MSGGQFARWCVSSRDIRVNRARKRLSLKHWAQRSLIFMFFKMCQRSICEVAIFKSRGILFVRDQSERKVRHYDARSSRIHSKLSSFSITRNTNTHREGTPLSRSHTYTNERERQNRERVYWRVCMWVWCMHTYNLCARQLMGGVPWPYRNSLTR